MAKAMQATAREYRGRSSAAEVDLAPTQSDSLGFLAFKNFLFWGSAALTCFGLYTAGGFLLG